MSLSLAKPVQEQSKLARKELSRDKDIVCPCQARSLTCPSLAGQAQEEDWRGNFTSVPGSSAPLQ